MDTRRSFPGPPSSAGRLGSWKEIAAYLHTSERTVQRWEQSEKLPIHRHIHDKGSSIYAYPEELERWLNARDSPRPQEPHRRKGKRHPPSPAPAPNWVWWAAALLLAAAAFWAWR